MYGVTRLLYLGNQEVNILLDEDVHLLLEDGLHFSLAFAAQVRGGLRDTTCHQGIALIGDLPGQVASSLIDLRPLGVGERGFYSATQVRDIFYFKD